MGEYAKVTLINLDLIFQFILKMIRAKFTENALQFVLDSSFLTAFSIFPFVSVLNYLLPAAFFGLHKSDLISLYQQLKKSRTEAMFSSFNDNHPNALPLCFSYMTYPVLIFSPSPFFSNEGNMGNTFVSFSTYAEKEPQMKEEEKINKRESMRNAIKKEQKNAVKIRSNVKKTLKLKNRQKNCLKKSKSSCQNAERNILPNIIHQIFCFIQKQKRSKQVIVQYLEKLQQNDPRMFNIDRFYLYQRLIKDKINNYINIRGLKELNQFQQPHFDVYSMEEQKNFIHMNRILIKYFLSHEFQNIVLTSSRMNLDTRPLHLKIKRRILEDLKETLSHITNR